MAKYELITGKYYGRNAKGEEVKYEKGAIVELADHEVKAFGDKFKLVEASKEISKGTPVKSPEVKSTDGGPAPGASK